MFRASVFAVTALSFLVASPTDVEAKRKKRKRDRGSKVACELSYLPFTVGKAWTYQFVFPPGVDDQPGAVKAKAPETFRVAVKKIEEQSGKTAITLEESYRDVVHENVLTCDEDGLQVPITSFFFAGELGALGVTIENPSVEGGIFPGKSGLKKGESMYVEVKADVVRAPAGDAKVEHPEAKLEIERQITIGKKEEVEVEHGIHRATAVEVALSGRAALSSHADKQLPLPEGNAMMWFAPDVGLVRVYNRLGQGWALSEVTDPAAN